MLIRRASAAKTIRSPKTGTYYQPVPKSIFQGNEQIESFVDEILDARNQSPTTDTTALESQIDLLVYHLYGLSYEEVKIVDPEFELSEEEYAAAVTQRWKGE